MSDEMNFDALVEKLTHALIKANEKTYPLICGISGAQGAGKSTLCAALEDKLSAHGRNCLILALDDFYLSQDKRRELARNIHPLCATRGVPGTHDVARLNETLDALKQNRLPLALPHFDKSTDDILPETAALTKSPDIILLEGWCVGAMAEMVNPAPETDWEEAHDERAVWKTWSRDAVAAYGPIWAQCALLIQMRQHDFDEVVNARWLQEQKNAARSGLWQFETRAAIADFCAHYESWTRGLWAKLPDHADWVIDRRADFTYRIDASPN